MYRESAGIYKITNKITGDFYIGSAQNLRTRCNRHFSDLKYNRHYNIHLQRAYNKYGKSNFYFVILLICDIVFLASYEQSIIDILHPQYNIRKDATSNIGVKRTDEYKKAVGDFFRGKKLSKEHIYNRSRSRAINKLATSPMYGIDILPSGHFRVSFKNKHIRCFNTLLEAQNFRTDYINNLFGGG